MKRSKTDMSPFEIEFIRQQVQSGKSADMLKSIFDAQFELDKFISDQHPDKLPQSISEWVIKLTVAMESEIDEVRGEVNWKHWKPEKEIDVEKLHEEVIDLWHFLVSLSQKVGLTPDKVHEVYMTKREENFKRQKGESQEKDYRNGGNE